MMTPEQVKASEELNFALSLLTHYHQEQQRPFYTGHVHFKAYLLPYDVTWRAPIEIEIRR